MGWNKPLRLKRPPEEVQDRLHREMLDIAREVKAALRAGSAVLTGRFRRGWKVRVKAPGKLRISNPVPYAPFAPLDETEARRLLAEAPDRIAALAADLMPGGRNG